MSVRRTEAQLVTTIVAALRQQLSAVACSVALLVDDELEFVAADGVGADRVVGLRLPVGRGLAGYVVASGQSLAVSDVRRDQRFDAATAESTGYVPTSILAVPVEGEDGPVGVLEVLDRQPAAHDLETAARAAQQVSLVIQLARSGAEVDAVTSDPRLEELVGLVTRFRESGPSDRTLAAALLRAVLDHVL